MNSPWNGSIIVCFRELYFPVVSLPAQRRVDDVLLQPRDPVVPVIRPVILLRTGGTEAVDVSKMGGKELPSSYTEDENDSTEYRNRQRACHLPIALQVHS